TKRKFYDQFGDSGSAVESLDDAKSVYEAVMEYINSIHRVQKEDIMDFFQQLEKLRKSGEVSATEKKELLEYVKQFGGDEKKCVGPAHCLCRSLMARSSRILKRC